MKASLTSTCVFSLLFLVSWLVFNIVATIQGRIAFSIARSNWETPQKYHTRYQSLNRQKTKNGVFENSIEKFPFPFSIWILPKASQIWCRFTALVRGVKILYHICVVNWSIYEDFSGIFNINYDLQLFLSVLSLKNACLNL